MSLFLASLLNNSLPSSTIEMNIQEESPTQVSLTLTNVGREALTHFGLSFPDNLPILKLPSSSCSQISLVNQLTTGQSCLYILSSGADTVPQSLKGTISINYTADNGQSGTQNLLANSSTYLYAATLNNVERWDGKNWSALGNNINKVQTLRFDPTGRLYAGTQNGVYAWHNNMWVPVGAHAPIGITTLGFDQNGVLYAGSSTQGVQSLTPGQDNWQTLGMNGPKSITSMIFAKQNLYVGTNNDTEVWDGQHWNHTPGAPFIGSVAFAYDQKNNLLYSGTDDGKVNLLNLTNKQGWGSIGQPGGTYDLVDALGLTLQNQLMAGIDNTEDSIQIYAGNSQWQSLGDNAPQYVTAIISDAQGNVYAANYGRGSNIFELRDSKKSSWEVIPDAPQNTFVNALAFGSELHILTK